jgi:competence protein ComGC
MNEPKQNHPLVSKAFLVTSIVGLFIGLVMVVVVPNFVKSHATSAANPCINNLLQIDAAAQEFALEKGKTNGETINYPDDLTPYINSQGQIPPCPKGGVYSIKKVGDVPTCSLGTTVTPAHVLP